MKIKIQGSSDFNQMIEITRSIPTSLSCFQMH